MPSEPDHKIEGPLKAYAEKRRGEAGAPLELHPVARKQLQAEIARQWPRAAAGSGATLRALVAIWPRLAFAAVLVTALGVALWVALPKANAPRELAQNKNTPSDDFFRGEDRVAKDSPGRLGAETKPQEPASTAAAPLPEARTAGGTQPVLRGGAEADKLAELQPRAATGPAPALAPPASEPLRDEPSRRKLMEDESKKLAADKEVPAPLGPRLSLAPPPPAPVPQRGGGFGGGGDPGQALLQRAPGNARSGGQAPDASRFNLAQGVPPVVQAPAGPVGKAKQAETFGFTTNPTLPLAKNLAPDPRERGYLSDGVTSLAAAPPTFEFSPDRETLARKLDVGKPGLSGAPAAEDTVRLAKKAEAANQPQQAHAETLAAGAKPAEESERVGLNDVAKATPSVRARFTQTQPPLQAGRDAGAGKPALLDSFELEQNGNRLRIYDADGSVYEGQVGNIAGGTLGGRIDPGATEKFGRQDRGLAPTTAQNGQKARQLNEASAAQPQSFRATGTNRTLNQLVIISGDLISGMDADAKSEGISSAQKPSGAVLRETLAPPAAAPAPSVEFRSPASGASTRARASVNQPAPPLTSAPVLRIQGRVKVGGAQEREIDAVRTPR